MTNSVDTLFACPFLGQEAPCIGSGGTKSLIFSPSMRIYLSVPIRTSLFVEEMNTRRLSLGVPTSRGWQALWFYDMEHEEISKKLDRLNADLARLEDSISTIYEEVLRLRVDVSGVQSRIEGWRVVTSSWVPPMPD